MRVEILETRLKDTDPETGTFYNVVAGDIVTVSDVCGKRWCDLGWVKDTAAESPYPSKERKPGAQEIAVPKTKVGTSSTVK